MGSADPRARFDGWREAVSTVFDLEVDDPAAFDCGMESWKLGEVVLGRFWSTGNRFERSARKVAESGLDHYVVQLLTGGRSVVRGGAAEGEWVRGSVRIIDMTRELRTEADAFSNLTLIVPRATLEPLLARPDDLHGVTLGAGTPGGALLGDFMTGLAARAPDMTAQEAAALGPGVAALVAGFFGPAAAGTRPAREARAAALRRAIRRHIEAHLTLPGLDADHLCGRFGLSRAALYRLFEPLGGVAAYVRERRLVRACRMLGSGEAGGKRVAEVAHGLGFASAASFSRDFRRRFDVSPTEVRLAAPANDHAPEAPAGRVFREWVERL